MKTTPEWELQFLQEGLQHGVLNNLLAASAHLDRMRDLLNIGVASITVEIEAALDSSLPINNDQLKDLSKLQEILCRQAAVLTPVLVTLQATANMFQGEIDLRGADIYQQMTELITAHPELLENMAAANAVASGDEDASTQGKRFELNRLLRSKGGEE